MDLIGIGIDLVDLARVARLLADKGDHALARLFTTDERDYLDRRKFLIGVQLLLAAVSVCLMLLSATGSQSVASLIALTFAGGIGAALMGPTWQAVVPELVTVAVMDKT